MTTVVLLRHARSTANNAGILAGRTPGVGLDDTGSAQATALVARLRQVPFSRIVSSPMERCRATLAPLAAELDLEPQIDPELAEVDYGDWAGRPLRELAEEPQWRTVQNHPSAMVFPGGESMAGMSARAVAAVRHQASSCGPDDGPILICSHGDVIAAVLADALGMHLDSFQRLVVAPASISVIRYTPLKSFVDRVNDTGDLGSLAPPPPVDGESDATLGGVTA